MHKSGKLRNRFFALLLSLCIVGTYMPGLAYAAVEEEKSEEPGTVTTEFTASGLSDGDKLVVEADKDEEAITNGKPVKVETEEGNAVTVKYEAGEASVLQLTVSNAKVPKSSGLEKTDTVKSGTVYTAQDRKGTFEVIPVKGASVEAEFITEEITPPAPEASAEAASETGEEASEGDDEESDPAMQEAADPAEDAAEASKEAPAETEEPESVESEAPADDAETVEAEPAQKEEAEEAVDAPAEDVAPADAEDAETVEDPSQEEEIDEPQKEQDEEESSLKVNPSPRPYADSSSKSTGLRLAADTVHYDADYDRVETNQTNTGYYEVAQFSATIDGDPYTGTCCQQGVPLSRSGDAEKTKFSNDGDTAKLIYEYAVRRDWWHKTEKSDELSGWYDGIGISPKLLCEWMAQCSQQSESTWVAAMERGNWSDGGSNNYLHKTWQKIHDLDLSGVDVPDGFTLYKLRCGDGKQDALVWHYDGSSHATLVKSAGKPGNIDFVSISPANYSLAGAKYKMYRNSACTEEVPTLKGNTFTFTTEEDGTTNTYTVQATTVSDNTWKRYVQEEHASPGFKLDPVVHYKEMHDHDKQGDNLYTFTSTDQPAYLPLERIAKYISDSDDPDGYKRCLGIVYTIKYYPVKPSTSTANLGSPSKTWTFVTREGRVGGQPTAMADFSADTPTSGGAMWKVSGKAIMPLGVFTIEETSVPEGSRLERDPIVYRFNVEQQSNGADATLVKKTDGPMTSTCSADGTWYFNHEDEPTPHYGYLRVNKRLETTAYNHPENYPLNGAVYYVYDNEACTTRATDADENVITLTTNTSGITNTVRVKLNDDGKRTLYVKEITAPTACKLDTSVHTVEVTETSNDTEARAAVVQSDEPPVTGYVGAQKKLKPTPYNYPGNYSLAGAVYYVYTNAACTTRAKDVNGNAIVLTTDESGKTNAAEVDLGNYWVKEITPPPACSLDPTAHPVTVTQNNTTVATRVNAESDDKPNPGYIQVQKRALRTIDNHPENYSLAGAEYYVYTNAACTTRAKDVNGNVIVLTTDESGATNIAALDIGNYWVKEITPPPGHTLDLAVKARQVTTDNLSVTTRVTIPSDEPDKFGYIKLKKVDDKAHYSHPENYTLAGAVYYVYTDAACTKRAKDWNHNDITLTTDANGDTPTVKVELGDYYAKEISVPANFGIDSTVRKATAAETDTEAKPAVFHSTDMSDEGWLWLKKSAADTDVKFDKEVPNNYSLEGAVFDVYTDAACTKPAKDLDNKTIVLTTDANGMTGKFNVDVGDYYAKERTAPKGYKINGGVSRINVTKANTESNPAQFNITDIPVYETPMSFTKVDTDGNFGWRKLLGTEYTIKFYDVDMGYGTNMPTEATIAGKEPIRTWTFSTIEKRDQQNHAYAGFDMATDEPVAGSDPFFIEDGERILPRGILTIEETKAAPEMAINDEVYFVRIGQAKMGEAAYKKVDSRLKEEMDLLGRSPIHILEDEEQAIVIELQKMDGELDQAFAQGSDREFVAGSLAGATYDVFYDDEKIGTIVTDESGYGKLDKAQFGPYSETEKQKLPIGLYEIRETVGSPGYVLDSFYYDANPKEAKNFVDGAHILLGKGDRTGSATVLYKVTSKEYTHHSHVYKKDITTGEELPGATLQVLDSACHVAEEWVSTEEPHDIVALHDETQGLKDGKYTLREITAPYGYDVAEEVAFEVKSDKIENTVTMQDKPITVGTVALDDTSKTQHGVKSSEATLTDTVKITGLYEGRTYNVTGKLYNKATGELLTDAEGNVVEAESGPFVAEADEMEVEVVFHIDSSKFENEVSLVAYEYLSRVSAMPWEDEDEDVPVEIAKHEDPDDEDQTIHFGGIASTVAVDAESGSHNVLSTKNKTVIDTVAYENLVVGQEYLIEGEWYDATDEKLTGEKAEKKFIAEKADGEIEVEFTFDTEKYEGHVLVCYERLMVIPKNDEGEDLEPVPVSTHEDPEDEAETIYIPEVKTTATAIDTEDHIVMAKNPITIKDVVKFRSLQPGKEYTFKGKLVYKDSGNDVVMNGATVTAETTYTPEVKDGEVELEFTFDASAIAGKSVVAFEEVYEEFLVGVHADLEDEDQTVHIPKIGTTAVDSKTKDHIGSEGDTVTVIDTVAYENLLPGKEYVMKGQPMLKSTGEIIKDADGNDITTELTFTPEKADGTVELTFEVPAAALKGDTIVVYEDLFFNDVEIAVHSDLEDEDQSVHIPEIGTTAVDSETKDHIALGDEEVTILDTVEYKNLVPGKKYTVEGTLMDKATGKALQSKGKDVTAKTEFTAEKADGSVVIEFKFDGTELLNKTLVAFENMYFNDVLIAVHADITDEEQTVYIPEGRTNATDSETKDHIALGDESVTVIDTVTYKNLIPGKEYTVEGTLMDKETGEPVQSGGKDVTASAKFTAEKADGEIVLEFKFDGTPYQNKAVVAFETIKYIGVPVAVHADLTDEDQTVYIPEAKTNAIDSETKEHVALGDDTITVIDTVTYKNLIPGKEYTVEGTLMDKETGNAIQTGGVDVTASATFTPEKADGEVVLEFTMEGTQLQGKAAVAFETVKYNGIPVAIHADLTDEDQTVRVPEIRTTAVDSETRDHISLGDNDVVIRDTVVYKSLTPGVKYQVKGTLMDKATGEPAQSRGRNITATATFTPDKTDGSIVLEFKFDGTKLQNRTLVAFEEISVNNVLVGVHADLEDEDQTVYIPEARTNAVDSETEDHIAFGDRKVTIIDTVTYKNLIPGKTYNVSGVLMDKSTGRALNVDGDTVKASATFIPDEPDGEVELKFVFDGREVQGKRVVAFETVHYLTIPVAVHADINDADQTVTIPKIGTEIGTPNGKKIIDTVSYKGLLKGERYVVRGWLVNKETGKKIEGSDGSVRFTAESTSGEIDVELKLGSGSGSKVAFEEIYLVSVNGEVLIGEHKDIDDEAQTYTPNPKPKTGENNTVVYAGIIFGLAAALALFMALRRRARKEEE